MIPDSSMQVSGPVRSILNRPGRSRNATRSATSGVLSMPPRIRTDEGRTLTIDEARKLLHEVAEHRMGVLVLLALVFGLRRGEALGLMWSGFDPNARTLRIHPCREANQEPGPGCGPEDQARDQRTEDQEVTAYPLPHSRTGRRAEASQGARTTRNASRPARSGPSTG